MPVYFEQQYCDKCMSTHWVELSRAGHQTCHGEDYTPHNDSNHYTRRLGRGIEVVESHQKVQLPIAWQMAVDARESAEI